MKIYLTGDRSMNPVIAVAAAAQVAAMLPVEDVTDLYTGDLGGFESAVRYLVPGVNIVESLATDAGKPDLHELHGRVRPMVDAAVLVHPDPLDSRVYASLVEFFEDDALQVVTL
jgi:hypothetical protein